MTSCFFFHSRFSSLVHNLSQSVLMSLSPSSYISLLYAVLYRYIFNISSDLSFAHLTTHKCSICVQTKNRKAWDWSFQLKIIVGRGPITEAYATHDLRTLKEGQECEELRVIITSTWQMNARQSLSWILNASWVLTLQLSMSVKSSSLELESRSASPVPHIRTRIIRTSFGRSIKHFYDLTELLQVLRDGIEGE